MRIIDRKAFLAWLSEVNKLSEEQKVEVGEVLAGRPTGEASVAAVQMGVGEDRTCPHCGTPGAVANGKSRGMQRYLCRSCNRTFGAVTGTSLNGLHRKDLWLTFSECLANGDTVAASVERCGIAVSTAFRWRHRFLAGISDRTTEGQHFGVAGLNLLPAIIIYWNTKHLGIAIAQRKKGGLKTPACLLSNTSSLG